MNDYQFPPLVTNPNANLTNISNMPNPSQSFPSHPPQPPQVQITNITNAYSHTQNHPNTNSNPLTIPSLSQAPPPIGHAHVQIPLPPANATLSHSMVSTMGGSISSITALQSQRAIPTHSHSGTPSTISENDSHNSHASNRNKRTLNNSDNAPPNKKRKKNGTAHSKLIEEFAQRSHVRNSVNLSSYHGKKQNIKTLCPFHDMLPVINVMEKEVFNTNKDANAIKKEYCNILPIIRNHCEWCCSGSPYKLECRNLLMRAKELYEYEFDFNDVALPFMNAVVLGGPPQNICIKLVPNTTKLQSVNTANTFDVTFKPLQNLSLLERNDTCNVALKAISCGTFKRNLQPVPDACRITKLLDGDGCFVTVSNNTNTSEDSIFFKVSTCEVRQRRKLQGTDSVLGVGFDCASRLSWQKPRIYWMHQSIHTMRDKKSKKIIEKKHISNRDLRFSVLVPYSFTGSMVIYMIGIQSDKCYTVNTNIPCKKQENTIGNTITNTNMNSSDSTTKAESEHKTNSTNVSSIPPQCCNESETTQNRLNNNSANNSHSFIPANTRIPHPISSTMPQTPSMTDSRNSPLSESTTTTQSHNGNPNTNSSVIPPLPITSDATNNSPTNNVNNISDPSMNCTINNPAQFSHSHSSLCDNGLDNGGQSSSSSTQTTSFPPPPTNVNASNNPLFNTSRFNAHKADAIMNDKNNGIVTSVNMPHMNGMHNAMQNGNGNGNGMNNSQNMQLQSMNGMSMGQMNGMNAMVMNGNGLAQMNANGMNAMGMNGMSAMTQMNGNGLAMNQMNGMQMTQMNGMNGYPNMNAQIITAANPMEQSVYNGGVQQPTTQLFNIPTSTQYAQIPYNANMTQMNGNGMNAMNGSYITAALPMTNANATGMSVNNGAYNNAIAMNNANTMHNGNGNGAMNNPIQNGNINNAIAMNNANTMHNGNGNGAMNDNTDPNGDKGKYIEDDLENGRKNYIDLLRDINFRNENYQTCASQWIRACIERYNDNEDIYHNYLLNLVQSLINNIGDDKTVRGLKRTWMSYNNVENEWSFLHMIASKNLLYLFQSIVNLLTSYKHELLIAITHVNKESKLRLSPLYCCIIQSNHQFCKYLFDYYLQNLQSADISQVLQNGSDESPLIQHLINYSHTQTLQQLINVNASRNNQFLNLSQIQLILNHINSSTQPSNQSNQNQTNMIEPAYSVNAFSK